MYKVAIVDGKEIGSDDGGFELMMRNLGYPLCVKFDEHAYEKPNVTKQDLVDRPDLFEPYRFIRSGAVWKYEECLEAFRYKNGKWVWDRAKSPDPNYVIGEEPGDSEIIAQDVAYMKQWYPELYKKVLELNELQEDDSGNLIPTVPQQNGKPHKPKPSVPPKQPQPTNQTPTTPQQGKSHTSKPTAPGAKKSNTAAQEEVVEQSQPMVIPEVVTPVTPQQGKSHIAKDIDLTNAVTTMRIEDTPTGLIMNEAGARYIVNNEPSDTRPVQPNENQTSVVVVDPQLQEVISRLQSAGEFNVDVLTESGITKVIVATTSDDRQVDSLCFTVDLNGVCQTTGRKMWFGLPLIPDFEPSYVFDNNAVETLLTGEGQESLNPVFNKNSCDLNKIVDLRSIFDIEGITNDDALTLMRTIKGLMAKRAMKIELQKKENDGIRFSVAAYKDPANFRLILKDRTYQYTGGPITTNKGKSSYVVVENGRMKFCNIKSKQTRQKQTQTLEDTAEAINKRFAEANKKYKDLTGHPHGMVNFSTHEAMQETQEVVTV